MRTLTRLVDGEKEPEIIRQIFDSAFRPNPELDFYIWDGEKDKDGNETIWISQPDLSEPKKGEKKRMLQRVRMYNGDTFTIARPFYGSTAIIEGIYGLVNNQLVRISGFDTLELDGLKNKLIDKKISHPVMQLLVS
jgi:hypothetical protein